MVWDPGWDDIFKENEWGRYPPEELVRFIARNYYSVSKRSAVNILEVGCGPGANLWFLAREGFSVYGVDGSQVAIANLRERFAKEKLTAQLHCGDAMDLPYADSFFDGVIDIECITANSLKDSRQIIAEVYRVLKPGGIFFSKTFMTGTYGDGNGILLEGEPHTYLEIKEGALGQGHGIIRLTAEEELTDLYGVFKSIEYDYLIRSDKNRKFEVKEWLITCQK